jgi:uncharacterized small protein (DUF1192 family)
VRKHTTIGSEQGRQSARRSPSRGLGDGGVGLSERELGRLEETVAALRADVDRIRAEQLSKDADARANRRAWLMALLPTAAFIADIVVHVLARP